MTIFGDYHTHTVFSHGKGGMEDNVHAAVNAGLKEIAITDHGFGHSFYNVRRKDYEFMLTERDRLQKLYPQIKIYLGLETNLLNFDGDIDISDDEAKKLDVFICGYHKMVRAGLRDFFEFKIPNLAADMTGKQSLKRKIKNTDAFIKAIDRYDIDIISHPSYGIDVFADKIAEAAVTKGTFMELNGKRVSMTDQEVEAVAKTGVTFIIDSDAHHPSRVGEVSLPLSVAKRVGIPSEQIANVDKLPCFLSQRRKSQ